MALEHHQASHQNGGLQKGRQAQSDDLLAPLEEAVPIAAGDTEHVQASHRDLDQQDAAPLEIGKKDFDDGVGHEDQTEQQHKATGRAAAETADGRRVSQLHNAVHHTIIRQRFFGRLPYAGGAITGDTGRQVSLQRDRQHIQPHRYLRKQADGKKTLDSVQNSLADITASTGILHAALETGHHQSYAVECPAQIGEEQHDTLYPAHLKQFCTHTAHLGKEIAQKAHDLAVTPVKDLSQHRVGHKIPDKQCFHLAFFISSRDDTQIPMISHTYSGAVRVNTRQANRMAGAVHSNWPLFR